MLKYSTEFSSKSVPSKFQDKLHARQSDLENASCTDNGVLHHTSANWGAEIHEPNYSPRLWHGEGEGEIDGGDYKVNAILERQVTVSRILGYTVV
ncbi:hypothetical protein KY289_032610 [Solanum tuberosum]|nr:hypothetical protein KY289_032610 [Solanum tuberosum]